MDRLTYSLLSTGLVLAGIGLGQAQDMPTVMAAPPLPSRQVRIMPPQESGVAVHAGGKEMGFQFVASEPAVTIQVTKGVPYSLEAAVDTEQTLADGNRIVHHQVVHVYRDSEGRTRREETLAAIGPWAASGTPPTVVTIQDPVSGVTYSLDPQNKIAIKLSNRWTGKFKTSAGAPIGSGLSISSLSEGGKPMVGVAGFDAAEGAGGAVVVEDGMATPMEKPEESSESLGKQMIAGVYAEGTRMSTTIPADAVGNERPIEITRERWFSPELQIVLRSKQTDPRFGVTTYEVTRLDRASPARSLFEVPRSYQIRPAPLPPLPPDSSK